MSANDREHLLALEPELRRSAVSEAYPRRKLPRALVLLMSALRIYVICSVALVILTFVRALTSSP